MAVFWHFFCFRRMCRTVRDKNRFVDHHTQYGMETLKRPFLFYCQKCPQGLYPHKRLDKNASVNGEKKKGGKKNE